MMQEPLGSLPSKFQVLLVLLQRISLFAFILESSQFAIFHLMVIDSASYYYNFDPWVEVDDLSFFLVLKIQTPCDP